MRGQIRVHINMRELGKIVEPLVREHTARITAACGEGYEGDVIFTDRPHGAVRPVTVKAKRSNRKHNTLLKAIG